MRILVTGATGFVGRWLADELRANGHGVIGLPDREALDIADRAAVLEAVAHARPDAVIHLAAMSYGPDASAHAAEAIRVNVGGALAVVQACRARPDPAALLVVGSSEVYEPSAGDAGLSEASPLGPRGVYGLTKLSAEALALAASGQGFQVAVARSFNHTGPGQRPEFAIPAFARRILDARLASIHEIRAGNVDVARDVSDVRDVVRAYRFLAEALVAGSIPESKRVYNVASGRVVTMRAIIDRLAALLDWPVTVVRDPSLVRADDPPVIRGDASALRALTGWQPTIDLEQTLADLVGSLA